MLSTEALAADSGTSSAEAPPSGPAPARATRWAYGTGIGLFVVQFVGLVALGVLTYRRFTLGKDFGIFNQAWSQIGSGHLYPYSTIRGVPYLKNHFELIMWPLALLYPVVHSAFALVVVQILALVAAEMVAFTWVTALVRRSGLSTAWVVGISAGTAILLLASPGSYTSVVEDFHFEAVATCFVVLAAYDLWSGRTRRMWVWLGLCLLCGDIGGLYALGLGLSALVVRERRRPGAGVLLAGLGWTALISLLGANIGSNLTTGYAYLAGRATIPGGVSGLWLATKGALLHPDRAVDVVRPRVGASIRYLLNGGGIGAVTPWGFGIPLVVLGTSVLQSSSIFIGLPFQNVVILPFVTFGSAWMVVWLATRARSSRALAVAALVGAACVLVGVATSAAAHARRPHVQRVGGLRVGPRRSGTRPGTGPDPGRRRSAGPAAHHRPVLPAPVRLPARRPVGGHRHERPRPGPLRRGRRRSLDRPRLPPAPRRDGPGAPARAGGGHRARLDTRGDRRTLAPAPAGGDAPPGAGVTTTARPTGDARVTGGIGVTGGIRIARRSRDRRSEDLRPWSAGPGVRSLTSSTGRRAHRQDGRLASPTIEEKPMWSPRRLLSTALLGGVLLLGTPTAVLAPSPSAGAATAATAAKPATGAGTGYWLVARDGGTFAFGSAPFYGSMGGRHLDAPVVGIAPTPGGLGYWLVASDGGVFAFGNAQFYGSAATEHLNAPVVGIAATTDGGGYWLVAADGGVFSYGDAAFHGSAVEPPVSSPVVGIAATPAGAGYVLVEADGTVFSFGDAGSDGSAHDLTAPAVGVVFSPDGTGYWVVGSDGNVYPLGDAGSHGTLVGTRLAAPVVGMTADPYNGDYWLAGADGGVFAFGTPFSGSMAGTPLAAPVSGMAAVPFVCGDAPERGAGGRC